MTITLQNAHLAVTVLPERGGRIDQITDLARNKDWLWHPAGYDASAPRELPAGAAFDTHWQGGFEEMFPNDAACVAGGRTLPDHGEAWSSVWMVTAQSERAITLRLDCQSVPVQFEKRLTLADDAPELQIEYRFTNHGVSTLGTLLKLHPAIAIEEGDEIRVPDCDVEAVALGFSTLIGQPGLSRWPHGRDPNGDQVPLDRALPAASQAREFIYCSNLGEGRCGVYNPRTDSTLELAFDTAEFPYVWLFQSYGGFDGHYVLMLEPCTSKPFELSEVIAADTALWLAPDFPRALSLTLSVR